MNNAVRRVITGHDEDGQATVQIDDLVGFATVAQGQARLAVVWASSSVPADNRESAAAACNGVPPVLGKGSALWVMDLAPGGSSPVHRTNSIDYGLVLEGELELELDAGQRVRLRAGDVVVQRGTLHAWHNPSEHKACRAAFVVLEAQPLNVDGTLLPEIHPDLS